MVNWEKVRPLILKALEVEGNVHSLSDILEKVRVGKLQLWYDDNSVLLTEVIIYPNERILNFYLAGGDLDELKAMHDDILKEAGQMGIRRARITGRRGWSRVFPEYKEMFTTFEREIECQVEKAKIKK